MKFSFLSFELRILVNEVHIGWKFWTLSENILAVDLLATESKFQNQVRFPLPIHETQEVILRFFFSLSHLFGQFRRKHSMNAGRELYQGN